MFLPSAVISHTTGGASFTPNGLNFYNGGSGNNYLIKSSLTGVSNSPLGSLSMWVRFDGGGGTLMMPFNTGSVNFLQRPASNRIVMALQNGTPFLEIDSPPGLATDTSWHHILCSWDTNHAAGAKLGNLYFDDVNVGSNTDISSAFTVDYTTASTYMPDNSQNDQISMSEIWFAPGQYIDFTNAANRARFSSGSSPISLGSDGSLPTGTAPAVYLHNAAATAGTNSGTGGNFTVQGTITDTSPP